MATESCPYFSFNTEHDHACVPMSRGPSTHERTLAALEGPSSRIYPGDYYQLSTALDDAIRLQAALCTPPSLNHRYTRIQNARKLALGADVGRSPIFTHFYYCHRLVKIFHSDSVQRQLDSGITAPDAGLRFGVNQSQYDLPSTMWDTCTQVALKLRCAHCT